MKERYIGINCSKCGRWVGKDGFYDYNAEDREIGYPLCKRCLDAQEPDAFEAEMNMRIENIDKAINKGTPHKTYLEGEKSGFRYALAIYQELL